MAQAAVVALMNVAGSCAAMTGVRSAPRYRFRVSTRIPFSCPRSALLLREDAALLTPASPAERSPEPQPVAEAMSNRMPATNRVACISTSCCVRSPERPAIVLLPKGRSKPAPSRDRTVHRARGGAGARRQPSIIVVVAILIIVAVAVLERLGDRSLRIDEAEAVLDGVAAADAVPHRAGEAGPVGEHCIEGRAATGDGAFRPQNALTEQIGDRKSTRLNSSH